MKSYIKGDKMKKEERYGDIFFNDIKVIRHSRFSHYLIEKESILELNSMKAIYLGFKEIDDMLDRYSWGYLYPLLKIYKEIRFRYIKVKRGKRRLFERMMPALRTKHALT